MDFSNVMSVVKFAVDVTIAQVGQGRKIKHVVGIDA